MASTLEKQELIEDIESPTKKYMITLSGDFQEVVYGSSCDQEYQYWRSPEAKAALGYNSDAEDVFSIYMFEKDDKKFPEVPATFRRRRSSEWYEMGSIDHVSGFDLKKSRIQIHQLKGSTNIKRATLKDVKREVLPECDFYNDFLLGHDVKGCLEKSKIDHYDYVYNAQLTHHSEVSYMFLELNRTIDLDKFEIDGVHFTNEHSLMLDLSYNDDDSIIRFEDDLSPRSKDTSFDVRILDTSTIQ